MRLLRPRNAMTIAAHFLTSCGQNDCLISLQIKENEYATT
jgi:hypothetical protein